MLVVLLLALIWAAVLVPPAMAAHRERQEAFLVSFGAPGAEVAPAHPKALRVQRRRRIAGGLLLAMAATFVVGLLPTFRVFLVVHLFLVDSFLFYVAVLAYQAEKAARARRPRLVEPEAPTPVMTARPVPSPRPVMLPAG